MTRVVHNRQSAPSTALATAALVPIRTTGRASSALRPLCAGDSEISWLADLKAAMHEHSTTQAVIASVLGIDYRTVSRMLMRAPNKRLQLDHLDKLCAHPATRDMMRGFYERQLAHLCNSEENERAHKEMLHEIAVQLGVMQRKVAALTGGG